MVYVQIIEYYIAIKMYEVPIQVITWMNLENVLSERCHAHRATDYDSDYMGCPE